MESYSNVVVSEVPVDFTTTPVERVPVAFFEDWVGLLVQALRVFRPDAEPPPFPAALTFRTRVDRFVELAPSLGMPDMVPLSGDEVIPYTLPVHYCELPARGGRSFELKVCRGVRGARGPEGVLSLRTVEPAIGQAARILAIDSDVSLDSPVPRATFRVVASDPSKLADITALFRARQVWPAQRR